MAYAVKTARSKLHPTLGMEFEDSVYVGEIKT
jgi:hypothetical protein